MANDSSTVNKTCVKCGKRLCLRQETVNLALGNAEQMYCLFCLADENNSSPAQVLEGIRDYIRGRECFRKEWVKYANRAACPDPGHCIPDVCFGGEGG